MRTKLKEKLEARKALLGQMRTTLDAASKECRALTADEDKTYKERESQLDALTAEADTLKAQIDEADKRAAKLAAGDGDRFKVSDDTFNGRRTTDPEPGTDPPATFGKQKLAAADDPARGFRNQSQFLRAVMLSKHPNGPRHINEHGRQVAGLDERLNLLKTKQLTAGSDEHNTIGGDFFIPAAYHPDLLTIEPMFPGMAVTKIPMESPKVDIPSRVDKDHTTSVSGGLVVTRRVETSEMASSRMKTEPISLVAAGQYGLAYITEELLNDSPLSIAAIIEAGFTLEYMAASIKERLYGSGIGEFLGVCNAACPCTITVDKTVGQTAKTITYANCLAMMARLWSSTRPGTCWLYSPSCLPSLATMTVGGLNWPVWMPSAREGEPDRLLGYPAYRTEFCKPVGTPGDIVLGSWGEYLEGTYQETQFAESIHVRFEWNERVYRFYRRNAGMPWWKTTFTPAEAGANAAAVKAAGLDLAPFVMLAVRA